MVINKTRISGFRNIVDIQLNLEKITALVGPNSFGKSNVMEAISFGFDFIKEPNVSNKDKMMMWKRGIPLLKINAMQNFSFDIELSLNSKNKKYFIHYGYEFAWGISRNSGKILKEYLRIKEKADHQKYQYFINRENGKAKYKSSETGRCSKIIKIEDNALVINKIMAFDDLFYLDIIKQINEFDYYIERHLDPSSSYSIDPFIMKGFNDLDVNDIQNIPRTIYHLKKQYPNKYELLENSFKQLFPNILEIDIKEFKINSEHHKSVKTSEDIPFVFSDRVYIMNVIDDNLVQPISFERMSDGAKRVFLMLTYAIIADIRGFSLISIEEPENSIHPALLQNYLDVLLQLVCNCKVLISSHSPYILQYLNPHDIYVGIPCKQGKACFKRISGSKVNLLIKDATEFNNSTGEYIFNLLSNEEEELEILEGYLEQ